MESSFDELLDSSEPHATFHDASLLGYSLDYRAHIGRLTFELCVGDADGHEAERERRRTGVLIARGLRYVAIEPPHSPPRERRDAPWLTWDGPLTEELRSQLGVEAFPNDVPPPRVLFFSDISSHMVIAADAFEFRWQAGEARRR